MKVHEASGYIKDAQDSTLKTTVGLEPTADMLFSSEFRPVSERRGSRDGDEGRVFPSQCPQRVPSESGRCAPLQSTPSIQDECRRAGNPENGYSGTPLIQTPMGQKKVSFLARCPYFRG